MTEESKVSVSKIDEFDVSLVSGNDGKFLKYVDATGKIELAAESNAINDYSVSLDKIEKDANKLGYIIHRDVNNDGKVIADN